MVSDLLCGICGTVLGWKYVEAKEESQRYKVGKFILETKRIRIGTRWDNGEGTGFGNAAVEGVDDGDGDGKEVDGGEQNSSDLDALEFDSQDEDECEDLFAGVWSPGLASRRRQRKSERFRRKAAKVYLPRGSQESLA